jgi:hypothetical protein
LADNRSESPGIKLFVIWDDNLGERVGVFENDMATVLAYKDKAGLLKSRNTLAAGDTGEFAHTATRRESNFSTGTGKF